MITKDYAVSVYIYYNGRVLLHKHKKLPYWLPVGGHIETNELPQDAAIRETKEESGLDIKLVDAQDGLKLVSTDAVQLIKPSWLLLEEISKTHQHIDFVYIAKAAEDKIRLEQGESQEFLWVTAENLKELDCPENVKVSVPLVIQYFNG